MITRRGPGGKACRPGASVGRLLLGAAALAEPSSQFDVLLLLALGLVRHPSVARLELQVALRRDAGLQLPAALELGVQLGDTVTWDVQGVRIPTVVTSLREVT